MSLFAEGIDRRRGRFPDRLRGTLSHRLSARPSLFRHGNVCADFGHLLNPIFADFYFLIFPRLIFFFLLEWTVSVEFCFCTFVCYRFVLSIVSIFWDTCLIMFSERDNNATMYFAGNGITTGFKIFVIPLFCIDKDTSSSKKKKINAILIFEVE